MCVRANVRVWEGRRDAQLLSPQAAWGASEPGRRRRCGSRQLDTGRQTDGKGFGGWRRGGARLADTQPPPRGAPRGLCSHSKCCCSCPPASHPCHATVHGSPTNSVPKKGKVLASLLHVCRTDGAAQLPGHASDLSDNHHAATSATRRSGAGSSSISAWRSQRWPLRAEFLNGSAVHKPCSLIHNFHRTRTHRFINPPL